MLGIIAKLKDMMTDLVEAILLIKSDRPEIVLPYAKPDLISAASHRSSEHLGHKRLSNTLAMPSLIHINPLDFGSPPPRHARRRGSPSELGIANEFSAVVTYEGLDLRIGDLGFLNDLAIRVCTMRVHVLARIGVSEGCTKRALGESRQLFCVNRFGTPWGAHGSLPRRLTEPGNRRAAGDVDKNEALNRHGRVDRVVRPQFQWVLPSLGKPARPDGNEAHAQVLSRARRQAERDHFRWQKESLGRHHLVRRVDSG